MEHPKQNTSQVSSRIYKECARKRKRSTLGNLIMKQILLFSKLREEKYKRSLHDYTYWKPREYNSLL